MVLGEPKHGGLLLFAQVASVRGAEGWGTALSGGGAGWMLAGCGAPCLPKTSALPLAPVAAHPPARTHAHRAHRTPLMLLLPLLLLPLRRQDA